MSPLLFWSILVTAVPAAAQAGEPVAAVATSPEAQLAELVAVDKAFAEKARDLPFPDAVAAMLAPDAVLPARGAKPFLRSRDEILAYLKANPTAAEARAEWIPVRGGISADGRQGFTAGYLTITQPDGTKQPGKYMTYWGRTAEGWRALAYKRAPRPEGAVESLFRPLGLPDAAAWRGAAQQDALETLLAAERAFAAKAQVVGVGPAFAEYGRVDAINMGAGAGYTESAAAIAAGFDPEPVPGLSIDWGPDFGIVSAAGDLGVSFGRITPKQRPPGLAPDAPIPSSPFFTIWHRDTPTGPWRYIAE
ncbi:nuclear transport factor 2 family protein [Sphingopyxis sp. BSN-002]|uniref:nuclear transport factor 2 family protein n=1 Tax=Sphingopyxis sp. BSN-002 TaxID=2911495 RepID=UPI001EDAA9E5|nr:nuclear transport factor 2 family protein [Sphingopyxis sp. BSN-002]UKK85627.1 nuclear transport factor 2 family protein [Sphingopyxis sp. BSN-002]